MGFFVFRGVFDTQKLVIGVGLLLSLLMLSACGGGVVGDEKNYIVVKDQSVIYLDEIVIERVAADQDLLIVVYGEDNVLPNTKSNTVLGYKAVPAGDYQGVVVKLDKPIVDNETLFVELRIDNGIIGKLEPGLDPLVVRSVDAVSFGVTKSTDPYIEIWLDDQGQRVVSSQKRMNSKPSIVGGTGTPVAKENRIDLKKVITAEESWLVAYRNNTDILPDELIGFEKLAKGHYSDVVIGLNAALVVGDQITVGLYRVNEMSDGETFSLVDGEVMLNNQPADEIMLNNEPVKVSYVVE